MGAPTVGDTSAPRGRGRGGRSRGRGRGFNNGGGYNQGGRNHHCNSWFKCVKNVHTVFLSVKHHECHLFQVDLDLMAMGITLIQDTVSIHLITNSSSIFCWLRLFQCFNVKVKSMIHHNWNQIHCAKNSLERVSQLVVH